jgi:L-ascorbate metabolism protein UlaG (beta-lactamase superfamily)
LNFEFWNLGSEQTSYFKLDRTLQPFNQTTFQQFNFSTIQPLTSSQFQTMDLIPAYQKDKSFLDEVEKHSSGSAHFQLWWLGQSGYLLQWNGKRIIIDPYLSDSLTRKYSNTNKQHTRMSERVIDPNLLYNISIVSSSHNHTDHLDAETLIPIINNNPGIAFIIPEANRDFVAGRINCDNSFPIGLNDGQSVTVGDFSFFGIPAKHNEIERDNNGNCRCMGYVISFGSWKIYHSGDTIWFDEMVNILKSFQVDLALLPINGNDPARGVAGNLSCGEAAMLAKEIGARNVIPCHYDMFTFNTADVNEFAREANKIGQRYKILRPGERFEL